MAEKKKIAARTLPHNQEAEQSLLGCILIDSEIAPEIISQLRREDFYTPTHQTIFDSMQNVAGSGRPVDFVTVADEIERSGNMSLIGGIAYLSTLNNTVPSSANFKHYLNIVLRDSTMRQLIHGCNDIIEQSYSADDRSRMLATAEKTIFDIGVQGEQGELTNLKESVGDVMAKLDQIHKNSEEMKGVLSGLHDLDEVTNGFQKGNLVVLAARPACGKTSLGMNIVENAAVKNGLTCAVFSLEMPKAEIAQRMLCSLARVSMTNALNGTLKAKDWTDLWKANDVLSQAKIFVDDTSMTTVQQIVSKCRRLKSRYGLDFVMIDYIQLMDSDRRSRDSNRQQEVADITRNLKIAAKELGVPILALSQLSRSIEKENRKDKRPQLSDLRESGAIEQDADIVLFLSKQQMEEDQESGAKDILLTIAKNRNGQSDVDIPLKFMGNIVRFVDSDDASYRASITRQHEALQAQKMQRAKEILPQEQKEMEDMMNNIPAPEDAPEEEEE